MIVNQKVYSCLIILMQRPNSQFSRGEKVQLSPEEMPQKQEWAIINKYKALEFQRIKQREQILDRQKKQRFRRELDQQLNTRNNAEEQQRQQDRIYYQRLSQLAEGQRRKEEAARHQKFITRRRVDSENIHKVEEGRASRLRDGDTGYHLEIGMQSQKEHKEKAEHFRKQMMDTLDLQLKQKQEEQKISKIRNQQIEEQHKRIQQNYFKPETRKHYSQNQKIYEYYRELDHQRQEREKELESRLVDEAQRRHQQAEVERERQEIAKKQFTKEIVKETLGLQVKENQRKRIQQSTTNPEQVSYGFISSIFEPKYRGYNKEEYKRQLQLQAEQQRLKKKKENHMSEEQYKLNLNQLSKAVIGDYAQNHYLDRSLGAVGNHDEHELDHLNLSSDDKDVSIIKNKLNNMRNRHNFSTIQ